MLVTAVIEREPGCDYNGYVPAFPTVFAAGKTLRGTRKLLRDAVQTAIHLMHTDKQPIPKDRKPDHVGKDAWIFRLRVCEDPVDPYYESLVGPWRG